MSDFQVIRIPQLNTTQAVTAFVDCMVFEKCEKMTIFVTLPDSPVDFPTLGFHAELRLPGIHKSYLLMDASFLTRRNENRNKEVVKILDDLLDAEVHVDYIKEAVLNTTRKSAIEAMNYYLSFDVARYPRHSLAIVPQRHTRKCQNTYNMTYMLGGCYASSELYSGTKRVQRRD